MRLSSFHLVETTFSSVCFTSDANNCSNGFEIKSTHFNSCVMKYIQLTDFRKVPKSANKIGQFWISIHFPGPPTGVVHLGGDEGTCSLSVRGMFC